jgi:very-short-patch-repair endonuclease
MKTRRSDPVTMERARALRKEPTPAEIRLWSRLRRNQLNDTAFRRQHAIGPYIADFCALKARLVVEVDGSQHLEAAEYDARRTEYLQSRGYRVLRFWNSDVMNDLDAVLREIAAALAPP